MSPFLRKKQLLYGIRKLTKFRTEVIWSSIMVLFYYC